MTIPEPTTCWMCLSNPAETAEHAVKASDIRARYGRSWSKSSAPVLVVALRTRKSIRGPNSALVKFQKTICGHCNSSVSQPFDKAYEQFSEYLLKNKTSIDRNLVLRFDRVYGVGFRLKVAHLLSYFMKLFGCAAIDEGIPLTSEFRTLIGQSDTHPFYVTISINEDVRRDLNHQTFAPLTIKAGPGKAIFGVMLVGPVEIRMWWHVRPHLRTYGTVFCGPIKKIVLTKVRWGSSTQFHEIS